MITDATTVIEAVRRIGSGVVVAEHRVGGGCIANASCVELGSGERWFVKRGSSAAPGVFAAEALGLEALSRSGGPRVPRVAAVRDAAGPAGSGESFIVMEWIEEGSRAPGFASEFGRSLARLHGGCPVTRFGFERDTFIGSTPQPNGWLDDWHDFFRERRIGFQARLAFDRRLIDRELTAGIESILNRLEALLPAPEHPSLLHGDLWGGNYLVDETGAPVLIDPAVYYGHREADLAMTELFGGFPAGFLPGYQEEWSLQPGYRDRSALYNLYHMLNHANIFGSAYVSSVRDIVGRYR